MEAQFRLGHHLRVLEDESQSDGEREGTTEEIGYSPHKINSILVEGILLNI